MTSHRRTTVPYSCSFYLFVVALLSQNGFTDAFSLQPTSFKPDTSPEIQRLTDWLDEDDGVGATAIGTSNSGMRGLYATESYDPGEYILAIPSTACLVLYERIYDMLNNEPDVEKEALDISKGSQKLYDMLRQTKEPGDWTGVYLDTLPTESSSHFDASPDFWDEALIRQLEVPQLVQDMLKRREEQTTSDLAFAKWLVRSRAFTTFQMLGSAASEDERTLRTRTILIPYIDMLNHATKSNTVMEKVETPIVMATDEAEDTSCFSVMATKAIQAGDELTLTYGSGYETCLDLVTKYGFWLPNNPNDLSLGLSDVEWSTSLQDDEAALRQHRIDSTPESQHVRDMLELRIHLKRIKNKQKEASA